MEPMQDGKGRCNYCMKFIGREKLMACGSCRMVRYCSKECQKGAWPNHKVSCKTGTLLREQLENDPEQALINARLSKWINYWRDTLHDYALTSLDLSNHPEPDRLETHIMVVHIEERPRGSSPSQLFRMTKGKLMTRPEVKQMWEEAEMDEEEIDDFMNDKRGNQTVQIIIMKAGRKTRGLTRCLWFSIREAGLARYRKKSEGLEQQIDDFLAAEWPEILAEIIEHGDASKRKEVLLEALMALAPSE